MIEWYETMGGAKLIEYIGANPPSPTAIAGLIVAVAEKRRQSGGQRARDQYKLAKKYVFEQWETESGSGRNKSDSQGIPRTISTRSRHDFASR